MIALLCETLRKHDDLTVEIYTDIMKRSVIYCNLAGGMFCIISVRQGEIAIFRPATNLQVVESRLSIPLADPQSIKRLPDVVRGVLEF